MIELALKDVEIHRPSMDVPVYSGKIKNIHFRLGIKGMEPYIVLCDPVAVDDDLVDRLLVIYPYVLLVGDLYPGNYVYFTKLNDDYVLLLKNEDAYERI